MQPSPQQLNGLQNTLNEEIRQHELAALKLEEKKRCLLSNKPDQLPLLDQELLKLAQKTLQLERQRANQMADMGSPNLSMRQFIDTLEPLRARPFIDARARLLRVVNEVAELNRNNRELIQLSMRWIEDSVEVIAGMLTPEGASYNAQGGRSRVKGQAEATPQSTVIREA